MIIRTTTHQGRETYVVSMVMLKVGVFQGSGGAVLYPAKELQATANHWNGRPVLRYHPDLYKGGIAGNPQVFEEQWLGTVFNTKFYSNKLVAEAWLDAERVREVDERILNAIQTQDSVEVSTGLFLDNDERAGTHNGRSYTGTAINYRPDHLAILPDQRGACSLQDGCGLVRNENGEGALLAPATL